MFQVQVDMMRKLEKRKLNFLGQHIHVVISYLLCPFKDGILVSEIIFSVCMSFQLFLDVCNSWRFVYYRTKARGDQLASNMSGQSFSIYWTVVSLRCLLITLSYHFVLKSKLFVKFIDK